MTPPAAVMVVGVADRVMFCTVFPLPRLGEKAPLSRSTVQAMTRQAKLVQ